MSFEGRGHTDDTPQEHHCGQDPFETEPLRNHLDGELSRQKTDELNRGALFCID
jgi:hypothetical protein